jgi:hypothetical protein
MAALAGSSLMPYRRFLAYYGRARPGISFVLLGYLAGNSYAKVEHAVGRGAAVAVALIAITAPILSRIRSHTIGLSRNVAISRPLASGALTLPTFTCPRSPDSCRPEAGGDPGEAVPAVGRP